MSTWKNPLPAVMALVPVQGVDQTRILCVRRGIEPGRGSVAFPGGYLEVGETWQEATSRELQEETGVEIPPHLFRIFALDSNAKKDRLLLFAQAPFVLESQIPPFTHNDEVQELVFIDQAVDLAFPSHTKVLKDYLKLPAFN